MRRINGLLLIASASALVPSIVSCGQEKVPPPKPPTTQLVTERPLPQYAQPMLIKQGKPTLVYLAEGNATLRFVDITANNNELARVLVKPRQIVRIDARRGVMLGDTIIRPGPLPNDHQYGIWLEPEAGDMMRDTTIRLAPQPEKTGSNPR
ncbi:MAG: hypothetical protein H7Z14_21710 [Anaerolineae bacterium]|nr:hypothetical protein [Phycisphaerae bacterium]